MAKHRCFQTEFINSDDFLSLSDKARLLYFYLIASTDDDGFLINHKTVMRICGASDKEFNELLDNGFLIDFKEYDSKAIVITHWLFHNSVQPSKKTETIYTFERDELLTVNDHKEYVKLPKLTKGRTLSDKPPTQDKLSKDNLSKDKLNKDKAIKDSLEQVNTDGSRLAYEELTNSLNNSKLI